MAGLTVLIVDDHSLVRAGLCRLLAAMPSVGTVIESDDGLAAMGLVRDRSPDVVLLDVGLPGLNGLEVCQRLTSRWSRLVVIMLSMHDQEQYVVRALRSGAAGYVLKDASADDLEQAILSCSRGERYLSPAVSANLRNGAASVIADPVEQLSTRKREVLQLIAEGYTTRRIAERLNLSVKTIESHRSALMQQLDIHDLAGLVRFAVAHGLVANPGDLPEP